MFGESFLGSVTHDLDLGERAPSSGIREVLPEVKVFASSQESSCLQTPTPIASAPKLSLVQVAQLGDDRQAEYQLKTNPQFIENRYLSVALIRINQLTDTVTQENSMYKSLRKGRIKQLEKNTS